MNHGRNGLPSSTQSLREVQNEYEARRKKLYQAEKNEAWDRKARSNSSEEEQTAEIIIRELREYERREVFGNQASEELPHEETRDMGGQFLTNKDRIEQKSLLFRIARRAPKGALLHLHFNMALRPDRLIKFARRQKNLYIRSICPLLSQNDLKKTEIVFRVLDSAKVEEGVNIFEETYPGNKTNWNTERMKWKVWMPWTEFQEKFETHFPDQSRGAKARLRPAEKWIESKILLSEEEAYDITQTVNGRVPPHYSTCF